MKKEDKVTEYAFGFTRGEEAVWREEDEVKHQDTIKGLELRLKLLYEQIVPFLDNLSLNPDKDTIYWPDRVEKINEFKKSLKKIVGETNI